MKQLKLWKCLVLCTALVWLVHGSISVAKTAYYRANGSGAQQTLDLSSVDYHSLITYDEPLQEGGVWLVSTDPDPQVHWNGTAYIDTVSVKLWFNRPATGSELYYKLEGQTDFSAKQVVYPHVAADGTLVFDLGGKHVTALRFDTESVGGIIIGLYEITLNTPQPWYAPFVPHAGEWILLLGLPWVLLAFVGEARNILRNEANAKK